MGLQWRTEPDARVVRTSGEGARAPRFGCSIAIRRTLCPDKCSGYRLWSTEGAFARLRSFPTTIPFRLIPPPRGDGASVAIIEGRSDFCAKSIRLSSAWARQAE